MDKEGKMAGGEIRSREGRSPYLVCLSPVGHGLLEDMGQGGAPPSGGRRPELSSFHSVGFPGLSLDGGGVFVLHSPVSLGHSLTVCLVTTESVWKKRREVPKRLLLVLV